MTQHSVSDVRIQGRVSVAAHTGYQTIQALRRQYQAETVCNVLSHGSLLLVGYPGVIEASQNIKIQTAAAGSTVFEDYVREALLQSLVHSAYCFVMLYGTILVTRGVLHIIVLVTVDIVVHTEQIQFVITDDAGNLRLHPGNCIGVGKIDETGNRLTERTLLEPFGMFFTDFGIRTQTFGFHPETEFHTDAVNIINQFFDTVGVTVLIKIPVAGTLPPLGSFCSGRTVPAGIYNKDFTAKGTHLVSKALAGLYGHIVLRSHTCANQTSIAVCFRKV